MASVRKIAEGKYQVLWREPARDEYRNPTGKFTQRSETITRDKDRDALKAASSRAAEIEDALASRSTLDPSTVKAKAQTPLAAYALRHFSALEPKISDVTLTGYRNIYRVHIAPTFGARPVASILTSDIDVWYSALLTANATGRKTKRSPKTAKQALGIFRRILNAALIDGAIGANPALAKFGASSHKTKDHRQFKHLPLTESQIAQVASYVASTLNNPIYGLAITFAAFTGLRAAELQGLELRDVDLESLHASVTVCRTKAKIAPEEPTHNGLGGQGSKLRWNTDTPKTQSSVRTVPLEVWLAQDLKNYLEGHPYADKDSKAYDPTAPLFPGRLSRAAAKAKGRNLADPSDTFDWDSPIDTGNLTLRYFRPALEALKLPKARFHDLRHSFAVIQLSAGVDFKRVSKWLGHNTLSLTLDTYGDYINADLLAPSGRPRPIATAVKPDGVVVPLKRKAR